MSAGNWLQAFNQTNTSTFPRGPGAFRSSSPPGPRFSSTLPMMQTPESGFGNWAAPERRTNERFRNLIDAGPEAIEGTLRDFIASAPPEAVEKNPRAMWQSALETLDLPRNAVHFLVSHKLFGVQPHSKETFAGMRKVWGTDLLQHMGWNPTSTVGKVGQFISGLVVDFFTDPLMWLAGLGGAAAGTIIFPGVGTAAGAAYGVTALRGVQLAKKAVISARAAGKGLAVARKFGPMGQVIERLHVRPKSLGKMLRLVSEEQKAGGPVEAILRAVERLGPEDLYKGRWGLGAGTHAARTIPLGHLLTGPVLIGGKAAGMLGQGTGRLLQNIPKVGRLIGKPVEWAGQAVQAPFDLLGMASSRLGTPMGRLLPKADAFIPFRELPGVGGMIDKAVTAVGKAPEIQALGKRLRGVKKLAAELGIIRKSAMMALVAKYIERADHGLRIDKGPRGILGLLNNDIVRASKATGMDQRHVEAVAIAGAEHVEQIRKHVAAGDPLMVQRALEDQRAEVLAYLADYYPIEKALKNTDDIMAVVTQATETEHLNPVSLAAVAKAAEPPHDLTPEEFRNRYGGGPEPIPEAELMDAWRKSVAGAIREGKNLRRDVRLAYEAEVKGIVDAVSPEGIGVVPDLTKPLAGQMFNHWTSPEGAEALRRGVPFDKTKTGQHIVRGKPEGIGEKRLYLSLDDAEWGTRDNVGEDAKNLVPVPYELSKDAKLLTISDEASLDRALAEAGVAYWSDETFLEKLAAKGWDAVAIRGVRHDIDRPGQLKKLDRAFGADQIIVLNDKKVTLAGAVELRPDVTLKPEAKPKGPEDIEGQGTMFRPEVDEPKWSKIPRLREPDLFTDGWDGFEDAMGAWDSEAVAARQANALRDRYKHKREYAIFKRSGDGKWIVVSRPTRSVRRAQITQYTKEGGQAVVLGPSVKQVGKWQATYFDRSGFSMDSLYANEEAAIRALGLEGWQATDRDVLSEYGRLETFKQGNRVTTAIALHNQLQASGSREAAGQVWSAIHRGDTEEAIRLGRLARAGKADMLPGMRQPPRKLSDIAEVWTDEVMRPPKVGAVPDDIDPRKPLRMEPRRPLKVNDLIITRIGGKVQRYTPGMKLPRNFIVVRLRPGELERFDPAFLAAALTREIKYGSRRRKEGPRLLSGTAQQAVRMSALKQIPVTGDVSIAQQRVWARRMTQAHESLAAAESITKKAKGLKARTIANVPELLPSVSSGGKTLDDDELRRLGDLVQSKYVFSSKTNMERVLKHLTDKQRAAWMNDGRISVDPKFGNADELAEQIRKRGFKDPFAVMASALRRSSKTSARQGIVEARRRVVGIFDRDRDLFASNVLDYDTDAVRGVTNLDELLRPGYVFRTAGEMEALTQYLSVAEIERFKMQGLLSIADNGDAEMVRKQLADSGQFDNPDLAMAQGMQEYAGNHDQGKVEAVIKFLDDNPRVLSAEDQYWVRYYQAVEEGHPVTHLAEKTPEALGAAAVEEGAGVSIAGQRYQVESVQAVDPQHGGESYILRGRDGPAGFEAYPQTLIDQGSRVTVAEIEYETAADAVRASYRSEYHADAGKVVRAAGLEPEDALLFDAAMEDLSPDALKSLKWEVVQESFKGMYNKVQQTISLAEGKIVGDPTIPLHELGHHAWESLVSAKDREWFRAWYQARSPAERTKLFTDRGWDQANARYFAGDPAMTAKERDRFKAMTDTMWQRIERAPEREGFAELFAHYALTRRTADPAMAPIFERLIKVLKRWWTKLRNHPGDVDQRVLDLMERIFEPATRKRLGPDRAINLKLEGMRSTAKGAGGRHSIAYKEGQAGSAASAARYADALITEKHAAQVTKSLAVASGADVVFVPIPSGAGENMIPVAMARRLAKLTGGEVSLLVESRTRRPRVAKAVIAKIANNHDFILARFPQGFTANTKVVLVDDFMYSGGSIRDANNALQGVGLEASAVVVGGAYRRGGAQLKANELDVYRIRGASADASDAGRRWDVEALEDVIGRRLENLTAGEASELAARVDAGHTLGQMTDDIVNARNAAVATGEIKEVSSITRTRAAVDDMPVGEDLYLERIRDLIGDGATPTRTGILEYAKTKLSAPERQKIFGYAKLGGKKHGSEIGVRLEQALLKMGHDIRGSTWDKVLRTLEKIEAGQPADMMTNLATTTVAALWEPFGAAGRRLTETGKAALAAMREALRVGGDPEHVARVLRQLALLKQKQMKRTAVGQPMSRTDIHRIQRLEQITIRMGTKIQDDVAWKVAMENRVKAGKVKPAEPMLGEPTPPGATSGEQGPPSPPAGVGRPPTGGVPLKMPDFRDMWTPEIATLVERMGGIAKMSREELMAAGIPVANLAIQTARGLGYFPHYLGDPKTLVGKMNRANGMKWEQELWKLEGVEKRGLSQKDARITAYQHLIRMVGRENAARKIKGLKLIPVPAADETIALAIAEILDEFPDLAPKHRSQLMRTFLRESTLAEINAVAGETGIAFQTDPVAVWREYRRGGHLAIAGADFLAEVVKHGLDEGWVVKLSGKGPVPKGFGRITDTRYGNLAKGVAFSDDIVKAFKKFQGHIEKPNVILRALDWATSQFRTAVLSVFPYTVTNLLSGVFQNHMFDAFSYESYGAMKNLMDNYHAGKHLDKRVNAYFPKGRGIPDEFGELTTLGFYELLTVEHGELGRGVMGIELEKAVAEQVKTDWGVMDAMRRTFQKAGGLYTLSGATSKVGRAARKGLVFAGAMGGVYRDPKHGLRWNLSEATYFKAFRAVNAYVEDWQAMSHIVERLRRGATLESAIQTKRLALNQSADMTDLEMQTFRRLIPFWGWMKGNAVLQFTMAIARPQLPALVAKIRGNLESALAGDEIVPPSLRPRHISEEAGAQLTGGERPEFINLTRLFPVKELGLTPFSGPKMLRTISEEVFQRMNPVFKTPMSMVTNRDFFWDRKLVDYPEQKRKWLGMRMGPKTKQIARMMRPLNVMEQIGWRGVPTTVGEAGFLSAQTMGVRTFPVDLRRQVFAREKELRDKASAVMRDLYRARGDAERKGRAWREDDEVKRLGKVYRSLAAELARLPMKRIRELTGKGRAERRERRSELKAFSAN